MDSLENKTKESNKGKTARQLELEGYKPLSNSQGYMFKQDGKPSLFRLNAEKQRYFPVNANPSLGR